MTLDKLIQRFEKGNIEDTDFEHPLARSVIEELAQCEENNLQKKIFGDAKILSDGIIERYLKLDREDKLKMAEVYETGKYFQKVGGLPPSTRKSLIKLLGDSNFLLIHQISNYSKIIPVLENYCDWIENIKKINPSQASLQNYLNSPNRNIGKATMVKDSLGSWCGYDFEKAEYMKSRNDKRIVKSLTYGVPKDLKSRVKEAESLLPLRIKVLENYCDWVDSGKVKPGKSSLQYYITSHTISGDTAIINSIESMNSWATYDFRESKMLRESINSQSKEIVREEIFESLTHGVPKKLKERAKQASSLVPLRIKILENYCKHVEDAKLLKPSFASLRLYLKSYDYHGNKANKFGDSLNSFTQYYFRKAKSFNSARCLTSSNSEITKSMLYGLPNNIELKVRQAEKLLPLRIKVLENYCGWIENIRKINPSQASLGYYLTTHNAYEGEGIGKGSLGSWRVFDFKEMTSQPLSPKLTYASITYGVKESLKERVKNAATLLPLREKVLNNYYSWVKKNEHNIDIDKLSLRVYLESHDAHGEEPVGSRDSLLSWTTYNFARGLSFVYLKQRNTNLDVFNSLTFGIKNKNLVRKVRQYALGK